jgi:hypothetical protein
VRTTTAGFPVHHEEFMDVIPYGYSLLIPAKEQSEGTGFGCSDDSDNFNSIFVVPAWWEEDETATGGLLPIIQSMEQSTERVIEESESESESETETETETEQSIDRAQE